MPEERTMSVFTKMNSAMRNRQQVRALVDMTQIRQWHMYNPEHTGTQEYPAVSFYNLDSLLNPRSNKRSSEPTISHKTDGSYLVAEDADGTEELGEEDTETWLDEMDCHGVQNQEWEPRFEMECDIDLRAVMVTQVLEEGGLLDPGNEMDEKFGGDAEEVKDPGGAWDW
ncbi:hypothetical protein JVT61DRAFT_9107 [Boletus reticuloceps]|uniref:Uncharacterized protein n=1 Tax=Boletus reticuloceps TaxID=495285 RepID=A0A8I2YH02_9AGAM|nr:hypothetical protein JVT61DRAFT_9107 [Boletus reticuloceps]